MHEVKNYSTLYNIHKIVLIFIHRSLAEFAIHDTDSTTPLTMSNLEIGTDKKSNTMTSDADIVANISLSISVEDYVNCGSDEMTSSLLQICL